MMLTYPLLTDPIVFQENKIPVLTVENPSAYRSMVLDLIQQCSGRQGQFILSKNFEPLDLSRETELITDVFHLDCENKKIITQLQTAATNIAEQDFAQEVYSILHKIQELLAQLTYHTDAEVQFENNLTICDLLKLSSFKPDYESLSFSEKLLQYIDLSAKFLKKRLFIILNLKSCMTPHELHLFYQAILYKKHQILLLEPYYRQMESEIEQNHIIDNDLCEIY